MCKGRAGAGSAHAAVALMMTGRGEARPHVLGFLLGLAEERRQGGL